MADRPLWREVLERSLRLPYTSKGMELRPTYAQPFDQGSVVLSGPTGDDIATGLEFDPEKAQYDAFVETMGKGFMSYGKSKGEKLNFLENIWRKGVAGYKAQRGKGMPDFKMTGAKKDVARKQEMGDTPGVKADVYRGAQERRDRPVQDWSGEKVSPSNYHPTKGWYGYEREPGKK